MLFRCGAFWNREEESSPSTQRAFDPDASTLSFDDPLGDIESQARCVSGRWLRLPIALEDMRDMVGRDAGACVRHGDQQLSSAALRPNRDGFPFGAELERIADEVREHADGSF